MSLQLSDFKLELAVQAQRMIRFEAHTFKEVSEEIYLPTDELIRQFATTKPVHITYISAPPIPFIPSVSPGKQLETFLILPDQSVVYLGSVLDKQLSYDLWQWRIKQQANRPHIQRELQRLRPTSIHRTAWLAIIPTTSPLLTSEVISDAVGRFLWHYHPELMQYLAEIEQLNDQNKSLASKIVQTINQQAQSTADPHISTLSTEEIAEKIADESYDQFPWQ